MTEMTQTAEQKALNIDWENLGFSYIKTDYRFISYWKDGKWDDGEMTTDNKVHISEGSPVLHYGQSCFEGMKAYRTKDGSINLFRPDENAKRMINSCQRLLMPEFPVEKFVEAAKAVVKANEKWVPPYNTGSTLYLRPYLMGVGDNIGVSPATEYIFSIFAMPVGPYFKGGLTPTNFIVSDYDRAAPHGTGAAKVGGNTQAACCLVKKRMIATSATASTWIQQRTRRSKKWAPRTSSASRRITVS